MKPIPQNNVHVHIIYALTRSLWSPWNASIDSLGVMDLSLRTSPLEKSVVTMCLGFQAVPGITRGQTSSLGCFWDALLWSQCPSLSPLVCVHYGGLWLEMEFRRRSCWLQFSHHTQAEVLENGDSSAGLRGLGTLAGRLIISYLEGIGPILLK